jgi:hypothetical protein
MDYRAHFLYNAPHSRATVTKQTTLGEKMLLKKKRTVALVGILAVATIGCGKKIESKQPENVGQPSTTSPQSQPPAGNQQPQAQPSASKPQPQSQPVLENKPVGCAGAYSHLDNKGTTIWWQLNDDGTSSVTTTESGSSSQSQTSEYNKDFTDHLREVQFEFSADCETMMMSSGHVFDRAVESQQ